MRIFKLIVVKIWKQLLILTLLLTLDLFASLGIIPRQSELLIMLTQFFRTWGLPAIAVCSFLENVAVFNVYFPGSIVILTGMALTAGEPWLAVATFFAIACPSLLAHALNFWAGHLRARSDPIQIHQVEFFLAFWHPQTAALATFKAGDAGWPVGRFVRYLLVSALSWYLFWALIMYHFGMAAGSTGWLLVLFYLYLIAWIIQDLLKIVRGH